MKTATTKQDISKLFQPRSVAMVGVSRREDSLGRRALRHLRRHGFTGEINVIHPTAEEIGSHPCKPSLADLDEPPDLVFVSTHGDVALGVVEEAVDAGAPAIAVIATDGAVTEERERVRQILARTGTRLLGPNGPGFVGVNPPLAAHISHFLTQNESIPQAPIGLITQSGAVGGVVAHHLIGTRLGFSWLLCTGNEFDVGLGESLEFLTRQEIRAVGMFVETIRDHEHFRRGLELAAERDIKLCAVKVGESAAGQRQALTHTGALTGMNALFEREFVDAGGKLCDNLEELAAHVSVATLPKATSKAVAVASASGGFAGILADRTATAGMQVPELEGYDNPWDTNAPILEDPAGVAEHMAEIMERPEIGAGMFAFPAMPDRVTNGFTDGLIESNPSKPLVLVPATGFAAEGLDRLPGRAAVVPWTGPAVEALRWWTSLAPPSQLPPQDEKNRPNLMAVDEATAKGHLQRAGIPIPPGKAVGSIEEAVEFAAESKRYVLKCLRPAFAHKAAAGAIAVGVDGTDEAIESAWREIAASVEAGAGEPMTQLLVEEMAPPGLELLVSVGHDDQYGAYLTIGAGGSAVEETADVAHRLLPVDRDGIEAACEDLRLGTALKQAARARCEDRQAPAALVELIEAACALADGEPGVTVEINPIILPFAAGPPVAVDCLYVPPHET